MSSLLLDEKLCFFHFLRKIVLYLKVGECSFGVSHTSGVTRIWDFTSEKMKYIFALYFLFLLSYPIKHWAALTSCHCQHGKLMRQLLQSVTNLFEVLAVSREFLFECPDLFILLASIGLWSGRFLNTNHFRN